MFDFSICKYHFNELISNSSVRKMNSYFHSFVLLCIFSFQDKLLWDFHLWCFPWSTQVFSFYILPTLFILASNLRYSWLGTTKIYCPTPKRDFIILFIVLIDSSLVWIIFPFNWSSPTYWYSLQASSFNSKLIWIFTFVLCLRNANYKMIP